MDIFVIGILAFNLLMTSLVCFVCIRNRSLWFFRRVNEEEVSEEEEDFNHNDGPVPLAYPRAIAPGERLPPSIWTTAEVKDIMAKVNVLPFSIDAVTTSADDNHSGFDEEEGNVTVTEAFMS